MAATPHVSVHLRSRAEVGAILHAYCRTTEFRAGPIIGSGSASFEMVRYLTERLPIMVAPRWILKDVQPIEIRDVLSYLIAALDHKSLGIVDIGVAPLTFMAEPTSTYIGNGLSWSAPQQRAAAERSPLNAYMRLTGLSSAPPEVQQLVATRRKSVNDLVRSQLRELTSQPQL